MELVKILESSSKYSQRKEEKLENYWKCRLSDLKSMSLENDDLLLRQMIELTELAINCKQYLDPETDFEEVKRVVRIRISMSRDSLKRYFGIETVSLYGVGLYAPLEGILMTRNFRNLSKYDSEGSKKVFDLSTVPQEFRENYDFRLAIPASGGLFIPKISPINGWFNTTKQLQYYDISRNEEEY